MCSAHRRAFILNTSINYQHLIRLWHRIPLEFEWLPDCLFKYIFIVVTCFIDICFYGFIIIGIIFDSIDPLRMDLIVRYITLFCIVVVSLNASSCNHGFDIILDAFKCIDIYILSNHRNRFWSSNYHIVYQSSPERQHNILVVVRVWIASVHVDVNDVKGVQVRLEVDVCMILSFSKSGREFAFLL